MKRYAHYAYSSEPQPDLSWSGSSNVGKISYLPGTGEALSTLISAHLIKVFGAENGELVSKYIIIWPGPRGLCSVVTSFILLSSSPPPMTMQSARTLWPGVTGQRRNQM